MSMSFSFSIERKRSIIALLVQTGGEDGLNQREEYYLSYLAGEMQLAEEDIESIRKVPENYPLDIPCGEQERMTILYYVLFLIKADGRITRREEELCYKLGLKLGFNHNLVMDFVSIMKEYIKEDIPADLLLENLRKYLN